MHYISTRGNSLGSFSEVLLEGLAPDGGLAVPDELPSVTPEVLEQWRRLPYADLATEVIGRFAPDLPSAVLSELCWKAYRPDAFTSGEIVPLTPLGDRMTLVGLSEGPTLAFKDMAMRFLGEAIEHVLSTSDRVLSILGATSGDTGSAAEYAFRGRDRVSVFMLSPQGRMSAFQRAQMYTLADDNIHNLVIDGVFDDCQRIVKELAGDLDFKREHHLGAVNSINIGRIAAQVVYSVWAWLRATDALPAEQRAASVVDVAVPSGNFGNILSVFYAKRLGVPIRRLVLATNENNVLDEFFRTGVYRPRGSAQTHATSSPSMDVSRASNLERFLFELLDRDPERTAAACRALDEEGVIDLSAEQHRFADEFGIVSGTSTHADRLATIAAVVRDHGVTIDPHTADGVHVADDHVEAGVPMLVFETAKPQKFAETIGEALGTSVEIDETTRALLAAPQHVTTLGNDQQLVRSYIAEHAIRG